MDLTTGDMLIMSGEGTAGTIERYCGARTAHAIRSRLSRERCHGDRWAEAWIETRPGVYGKLSKGLDEIGDEREIPAAAIRDNPAAQLRAGKPSPHSAANGAKGGAPRKVYQVEYEQDGGWFRAHLDFGEIADEYSGRRAAEAAAKQARADYPEHRFRVVER